MTLRMLITLIAIGLVLSGCASDRATDSKDPGATTAKADPGTDGGAREPRGTGLPGRVESFETSELPAMPGTQEQLADAVGDTVLFGFDQSELSEGARATLDKQASWLKRYRNLRVTVEGHADERGTREYNLALGARRANSVKNYLVAQGVAPERISTISYGKERPAVGGSNPEAWRLNRRAVTTVN